MGTIICTVLYVRGNLHYWGGEWGVDYWGKGVTDRDPKQVQRWYCLIFGDGGLRQDAVAGTVLSTSFTRRDRNRCPEAGRRDPSMSSQAECDGSGSTESDQVPTGPAIGFRV